MQSFGVFQHTDPTSRCATRTMTTPAKMMCSQQIHEPDATWVRHWKDACSDAVHVSDSVGWANGSVCLELHGETTDIVNCTGMQLSTWSGPNGSIRSMHLLNSTCRVGFSVFPVRGDRKRRLYHCSDNKLRQLATDLPLATDHGWLWIMQDATDVRKETPSPWAVSILPIANFKALDNRSMLIVDKLHRLMLVENNPLVCVLVCVFGF